MHPSRHLAACLLILCTGTSAQQWTQFRGPNGQGLVKAPGLPDTFTAENRRWQVPIGGSGHSSPVVWGKQLYLTRVGDSTGSRDVVCFDTATGKQLWATACAFEPHRQHRFNSFASSTPAVDADGVYILWSSGGELFALALNHQGKQRWRRKLGQFRAQHGSGTSPILHQDQLIVANENEGDESFLLALDTSTGKAAWRIERNSTKQHGSYCCPVVYRNADDEALLLFASQAHGLSAVDPKAGKLRWELDLEFGQRFVATPCLIEAVAATDDQAASPAMAFVFAGSGGGGKESAFITLPGGAKESAKIKHRMRRSIPYVPCAVSFGKRVFTVNDGGVVSCVQAEDGALLWRGRLDGSFFSSPVSNGKVLYIPDRSGTLHSLAMGDEFRLLGTFDLGGPTFATPAIVGELMFLRTNSDLLALGATIPRKQQR